MLKLDLACGQKCKGFDGVDYTATPATKWIVDLVSGERWPWGDESVNELYCSHFIEHIPAEFIKYGMGYKTKDALFFFFDEAWRVAKRGAIFTIIWPNLKNVAAFQDPTHRRFLPLEFTNYLNRATRERFGVQHYNVNCDWQVESAHAGFSQPPSGFIDPERWDQFFSFEVTLIKPHHS